MSRIRGILVRAGNIATTHAGRGTPSHLSGSCSSWHEPGFDTRGAVSRRRRDDSVRPRRHTPVAFSSLAAGRIDDPRQSVASRRDHGQARQPAARRATLAEAATRNRGADTPQCILISPPAPQGDRRPPHRENPADHRASRRELRICDDRFEADARRRGVRRCASGSSSRWAEDQSRGQYQVDDAPSMKAP